MGSLCLELLCYYRVRMHDLNQIHCILLVGVSLSEALLSMVAIEISMLVVGRVGRSVVSTFNG